MTAKTAVVTGAATGIGAACTTLLLNKGIDVLAIGRNPDHLATLDASIGTGRLITAVANVRYADQLAAAVARIDRVDYVVANAGVVHRTPLTAEKIDAVFDQVVDINLTGVWRTFRAVRSKLQNKSACVAVSSGLGKLGREGYSAYAASKHGVLGIVKCLARELAPKGIRVNAVCPGWVDTDMAKRDMGVTVTETGTTLLAVRKEAENGIPLGRFVTAQETAKLIGWLLSDEASAVTGQAYNISCGEFTV